MATVIRHRKNKEKKTKDPEKVKRRRELRKKIIFVLLIILMIGAILYVSKENASPTSKNKGNKINKAESVYVTNYPNGKTKLVKVECKLKNNKDAEVLKDKTCLTDIENISGDEPLSLNSKADILTLQAKGRDITYKGYTNKKILPIKMNVKYYLNGKRIKAKQIANGVTGKFKMVVTYKNTATEKVDGKDTPVAFMCVSMLTITSGLSNISITNGEIINTGAAKFAMSATMPGVVSDIEAKKLKKVLTDKVVITGNANNYSDVTLITFVTPDALTKVNNGIFKKLNLDKSIARLDKASHQLINGSTRLANGTTELNTEYKKIVNGTKQLKAGTKQLAEATNKISSYTNMLVGTVVNGDIDVDADSEANSLTIQEALKILKEANEEAGINAEKMKELKTQSQEISSTLQKIEKTQSKLEEDKNNLKNIQSETSSMMPADTAKDFKKQIESLADDIKENNIEIQELRAQYEEIQENIKLLNDNNDTIQNDIKISEDTIRLVDILMEGGDYNSIMEEAEQFEKDYKAATGVDIDVKQMIINLLYNIYGEGVDKIEGISDIVNKLNDGCVKLDNGMGQLMRGQKLAFNGIHKINNGSIRIKKGMKKYYKVGISKIVKAYNGYAKGASKALLRSKKASMQYRNVTGLPQGWNGSVYFLYRTQVISNEDE